MDHPLTYGRRRRRGAAMVEMALVLPILIGLTFGAIEYGWMFFRASQVNQAARHGTRTAVRPAATAEEIEAAVTAVMSDAGFGTSDYSFTVTPTGGAADVGDEVTVAVTANYSPIGGGLVPTPDTVFGTATMAKEGPE